MGAKTLSYDEHVRVTDAFDGMWGCGLAADMYQISPREVYRLEARKKAGDLALRTHDRGRKPKLNESQPQAIHDLLVEKPDITLKDLIKALDLSNQRISAVQIIRSNGDIV